MATRDTSTLPITPPIGITDQPARILIVDDESLHIQLLEVMLSPEGFLLQAAASGDEALTLVEQQPPDLILLDVMMPGVDGYQVAARIKANPATKNIPIILITELDDRNAKLAGLSAGAEDFLSKPVDRAELCMRVRNLLRLKTYGDHFDKYSQILASQVDSRTADLVESESLYRSTFDAAPVGIVHVGLDGRWLRVNQRLCDLLGYPREELLAAVVQEPMQSDEVDDESESFRQMVAGTLERHLVDEKRYRRRDGSLMWARANTSIHRDARGQAQHFITVIEDITERRRLEAQVRQGNKMDSIGRLAAGVAHDFNNMLTVILGFAELEKSAAGVTTNSRGNVDEIIKAANRAADLTKQLLAFSRQQVLHEAPLDVNGLITDMTGMLGRLIGKNIKVTLTLAPDVSLALVDRSQLEQVVVNLVVNARDAMPDGGRLTIETRDAELENYSFHEETVMQGHYVMLAIKDTGGGMTKETQRRVFEPFFTTKQAGKGVGLGLSTTYGIIKQSKGYIWLYSELGQGTTFNVYLPRSDRDVPVAPGPVVITAPIKNASETVLLVEDEVNVRNLAKRILDNAGYRVFEAADGNEAEKLFAEHGAAIDLVITDVSMPGHSGPELVDRLQVRAPDLKAMYMSGYTEPSTFHSALDRPETFVQKPFTAAVFLRKVREALDR